MAGLTVEEILAYKFRHGQISEQTFRQTMAKLAPRHTVDSTPTPLTFDAHGRGLGGYSIPLINPEPLPAEAPPQAPLVSPSDDIGAQFAAYINSHPSTPTE